MKSFNVFTFVLIVSMMFQVGCASKRTAGWNKAEEGIELSQSEARVLLKTAKRLWAERHEKESLAKALDAFEKVAKADPSNYEALVYLCRGKYFMADGHMDDADEKKKTWEEGVTWGEKAMATNEDFRKAMLEKDATVADSLHLLNKNQIEAVYWTATNLGKWASLSGIATKLKYKGQILKMINRVGDFDKKYFYSAYDRYYGAFYAIAPGFAGGDINKSLESFNKSISKSKDYLGTKVLKAQYWATKAGNKGEFKKLLNEVINANPKAKKDIMPENIIEQRKAKKLLANMDELF